MEIGVGEYGELLSIRKNVHRTVGSLELCWSCQRICECQEASVNEDTPLLWVCNECLGKLSAKAGGAVALSAERGFPDLWPDLPSDFNDVASNLVESERNHVWMRQCPGCNSPIEKRNALDLWKCHRCGWE